MLLSGFHALCFFVLLVIPTEEVEYPMDNEESGFRLERHAMVTCVCCGHLGADHDVAKENRCLGFLVPHRGASGAAIGKSTSGGVFIFDGEAEYVRGSLLVHETLVELSDGDLIDEEQ